MLTNREFHLQTGNLAYKTGFSFTKRDSWVTKGILGLLFTIWKSGDDDETEKTLVLYLKDETVLDLCDDGAFSSEQGDFEKAQRQAWPQS